MKKHSGFGEQPEKLPAEVKVLRYLARWSQGLSTLRMHAWIDSCSRGGGYTLSEFETALKRLRDSDRIAFANGVWYLRSKPTQQANK